MKATILPWDYACGSRIELRDDTTDEIIAQISINDVKINAKTNIQDQHEAIMRAIADLINAHAHSR